ncbi:hypothetical protein BKA70DRAFT_1095928 [Coprinopsis sp. MPI-PUGE-AT-0042]|nr:hypothetical protein BKA70DRAFT_1095928 [Coprinopsis sp. MPI-PUGE-AT-0042]
MSNSTPNSRFAKYSAALQAISKRTGTPLPSLILSFGILHEVTAVAPLFIVFYGARTFGVGDKLVNAISDDLEKHGHPERGLPPPPTDAMQWGRRKLAGWMDEGQVWAARVGTRYGVFGYDKRLPGEKFDESVVKREGGIAGDVANAVVAYAVTKAALPLRIGLSLYLAPGFSRGAVEPVRRSFVNLFRRRT